jgi:hypothetical protein
MNVVSDTLQVLNTGRVSLCLRSYTSCGYTMFIYVKVKEFPVLIKNFCKDFIKPLINLIKKNLFVGILQPSVNMHHFYIVLFQLVVISCRSM